MWNSYLDVDRAEEGALPKYMGFCPKTRMQPVMFVNLKVDVRQLNFPFLNNIISKAKLVRQNQYGRIRKT